MKKQAMLKIHGDVQGVFYRAHAKDRADELGLAGWVRNLADGTVEICAQGSEETIKELISWCYEGPPASQVDEIKTDWQSMPKEKFDTFEIKY
jgi:acylphosphatase